jgi:hypothetical protein
VIDLKTYLIANSITFVCAIAGFIYGGVCFFKPKKAGYAQMITMAVGCMAFGRLYQIVRILTVGDFLNRFQLGVLGVIGSLVFIFSANFGLMDRIGDDGSKRYLRYRLIPLAAPLAAVGIYLLVFPFSDQPKLVKIMAGVITFFVMEASYFNLKHLIFPDVDFGILKCMRAYNLFALIFAALCSAEMIAYSRGKESSVLIISILMGITLTILTPCVKRGIDRWTT